MKYKPKYQLIRIKLTIKVKKRRKQMKKRKNMIK